MIGVLKAGGYRERVLGGEDWRRIGYLRRRGAFLQVIVNKGIMILLWGIFP